MKNIPSMLAFTAIIIAHQHINAFDARMVELAKAYSKEANDQQNLGGERADFRNLSEQNIYKPLKTADLSGADLSNLNLRHIDLENAKLTMAKLIGTDLTWSSLPRNNLQGATFSTTTTLPAGFDTQTAGMILVKYVPTGEQAAVHTVQKVSAWQKIKNKIKQSRQ
jgi:uncharacterized protein YjbI with pentapeptide repeats